jgi:hypothetical protein
MFDLPIFETPVSLSYSDTQFEILKKYIQDFEKTLDSEHEVGLLLTNFGQTITMRVTDITYEEPVLMVFKGYVGDKKSTLLQHISQLNFLLTSIDKLPEKGKITIGFHAPDPE